MSTTEEYLKVQVIGFIYNLNFIKNPENTETHSRTDSGFRSENYV